MPVEYHVVERDGCVLVFGALTVDTLLMFTQRFGEAGVMDADLARMAEATFAMGEPAACAALKAKLAGPAEDRTLDRYPDLPVAAACWLASGERGQSADAMFHQLTGVDTSSTDAYPHDPADLRRCRLLLERVPEYQDRFKGAMHSVSPEWRALTEAWDTICAAMDQEAPDWRACGGSAAETYNLMRGVLRE